MANITSFSSANNSSLTVDNSTYLVENANRSYSLTEPDTNTLRFQLQSGDHWSSPDYTDPSTSQRDEIAGTTVYQPDTQINLSYNFMVEPGATDTSNGPGKWTVLGQMHEYNVSDSPPFAVELVNGDHMAIDIGTGNPNYLYIDPNPIVRGQYYSMQAQMKFDANGNGFLDVWRNGVQIVNYHGSLGTGVPVYWKEGIYRSSSDQTMAVDYRNLSITTGAASAPTSSTTSSGTTSATGGGQTTGSAGGSSTTTTPIAPTLTVADHSLSVSPGGHVSLGIGVSVPHAGDNVSVTIAGLPKYETITDHLDHKTFSGSSVTLTAAEVNSGLSLSSSYRGQGHPTATLKVTAHDATGTPVTSAAQSITVLDPPATTTSSGTSTTSSGAGSSSGHHHHHHPHPHPHHSHHHHHHHHHHPHAVAATSAETSTRSASSSGASTTTSGHPLASGAHVAHGFNDHAGFAPVATTLSDAKASSQSSIPNLGTTTATPGQNATATAYAVFNQMMAREFGGDSHFAETATAALSALQQHAHLLTRPVS